MGQRIGMVWLLTFLAGACDGGAPKPGDVDSGELGTADGDAALGDPGGAGAGAAVAGSGGGSGSGPGQIVPECAGPGEDCLDDPLVCCADTACVRQGAQAVCAAECSEASDCASGCCAATTDGNHVCAPPENCNLCSGAGEDCSADFSSCCAGSTCVANSAGYHCADNCTKHSECTSGCCSQLANTAQRVCSPLVYCQ